MMTPSAPVFSAEGTATIIAAGHIAHKVLAKCGIHVFAYVKEAAGVKCGEIDHFTAQIKTEAFKKMRSDHDPFYQEIYEKNRINPDMHFLEKMSVFAKIEKEIDIIRNKAPSFVSEKIKEKYGVHPVLNCPDLDAADEMVKAINRIAASGDSSGGVIEVIALGLPIGLGEPVFDKLDAEFGKMLGIGAVKSVEIGAGLAVKDMTGIQSNDAMHVENKQVLFDSNNAGGVTGGLSNGAPVIIRLGIKPTPTIDKKQHTIDKYTLENKQLEAITRRDPTIVARIWPVAENYSAMVILDNLIAHFGYQKLREMVNE